MKRIAILNGPNLNLLGTREPGVYGHQTLEDLEASWVAFGQAHGVEVICFQSNVEGELIDAIQANGFDADAILINPGGYTTPASPYATRLRRWMHPCTRFTYRILRPARNSARLHSCAKSVQGVSAASVSGAI